MNTKKNLLLAFAWVLLSSANACTSVLGDFEIGSPSVANDGGIETGGEVDGGLPVDTGNAAEATVGDGETGAARGQLTVDKASYDFGTFTIGSTIPATIVTVTNRGSGASAPLTVELQGANASTFTVTDLCHGVALAAGSSCTASVTPLTSTAGAHAAKLVVVDGASDRAETSLVATVVAPGALSIAPSQKDFGSVGQNVPSGDATFTVTNMGSQKTGSIGATVTGGGASQFSSPAGTCIGAQLDPNATCTVSLHMIPTALGSAVASLAVSANPGGTATATVQGQGVTAAALAFTTSPASFFGTVDVGGAAPGSVDVTVKNTGGVATPSALALSFSGTNSGDFSKTSDNCSAQPLAASATCTVRIIFSPASRGPRVGSLDVTAGVSGSLPLSGTGRDYVTLTVQKLGTGGGTVTGDQINCGPTSGCTENAARTTVSDPVITLTATADATSAVTAWSYNGCSGSSCAVTMSQAQTVQVTFTKLQYRLTLNTAFYGTIAGVSVTGNPGGLSCTADACSVTAVVDAGSTVTLAVSGLGSPPSGYLFHWTGDCTGTVSQCNVTMTGNKAVTARVTAYNYAFVTSATYPTNFGGTSQADTNCNALAVAAGIPGNYRAFLSTDTVNANSRYAGARGWIRLDGLPVMDKMLVTGAEATNGLFYPIAVDQTGAAAAANRNVLYGSNGDGSMHYYGGNPSTCSGWTSSSSAQTVFGGYTYQMGGYWTGYWGSTCTANPLGAITCLGTDLSHALPTPFVPANSRYVFVSKALFNASRGISPGTTTGTADNICQSEATAAGLPNGSTYKAFIATSTASAASRVSGAGTNWLRTDGWPVAASTANFLDGQVDLPVILHADRTYVNEVGETDEVRTGAPTPSLSGTSASTCANWTSNAASVSSTYGRALYVTEPAGSPKWFNVFTRACDSDFAVYCIAP